MSSPNEHEHVLDLEASSQIELGRVPGCDSEVESPDDTVVLEPQGTRTRSHDRELLHNWFDV
jgi:hypothetical protein